MRRENKHRPHFSHSNSGALHQAQSLPEGGPFTPIKCKSLQASVLRIRVRVLGIRDRVLGMGDSVPGIRDSVLEIGDTVLGIGDSVLRMGDSVPGIGDTVLGIGDSVLRMGDSVAGIRDSVLEIGDTVLQLSLRKTSPEEHSSTRRPSKEVSSSFCRPPNSVIKPEVFRLVGANFLTFSINYIILYQTSNLCSKTTDIGFSS